MCIIFFEKRKIKKQINALIDKTDKIFDNIFFEINEKYPEIRKNVLYDAIRIERHHFETFKLKLPLELEYGFIDDILDETIEITNSIETKIINFHDSFETVIKNIKENKDKWFKNNEEIPFFFIKKPINWTDSIGNLMYSPNLCLSDDGTISGNVFTTDCCLSKKMEFVPENDIIIPMSSDDFEKYLRQRLDILRFKTEKETQEYINYLMHTWEKCGNY